MEKTVYFIENKITKKWVAPMYKMKEQYTRNPNKALSFDSKEQAEYYGLEKDEIITEHLFIEDKQEYI